MSSTIPVRALLMSSEIQDGDAGFHRLQFKVDAGRGDMSIVTVLISQDAHRKLAGQLARARLPVAEKPQLLMTWARWEIAMRLEDYGMLPRTLTVTAKDLDDFGAYAIDLGRHLRAG
ncbi:MAG: hypothetical protein M0R74_13770 [Dehalococcoidia bacterium]|nr:hypothetical protein [Dehalococcoidia bacterium]